MSTTIGIWAPGDVVFAGNVTEDAAYVKFINNRQVLVFPDNPGAEGEFDYHAFFMGIVPVSYTGGDIDVDVFCTNEDVPLAPSKVAAYHGAIQRHNLGDPILTLSYGTEEITQVSQSTTNYTLRIGEDLDFDTAAKRDNLAAGDMFTLRLRRDGAYAGDNLSETSYLIAVHMYETFS